MDPLGNTPGSSGLYGAGAWDEDALENEVLFHSSNMPEPDPDAIAEQMDFAVTPDQVREILRNNRVLRPAQESGGESEAAREEEMSSDLQAPVAEYANDYEMAGMSGQQADAEAEPMPGSGAAGSSSQAWPSLGAAPMFSGGAAMPQSEAAASPAGSLFSTHAEDSMDVDEAPAQTAWPGLPGAGNEVGLPSAAQPDFGSRLSQAAALQPPLAGSSSAPGVAPLFEEGRSYNPGDRVSSPGGTEYVFKAPLGSNTAVGVNPNTNNQRILMTDPPATRFDLTPKGKQLKAQDAVEGMRRLLQNPGLRQKQASRDLGRDEDYLKNIKHRFRDLPRMSQSEAGRIGGRIPKKDGTEKGTAAKKGAQASARRRAPARAAGGSAGETPALHSQPPRLSASRREPEFVEGTSSRPALGGAPQPPAAGASSAPGRAPLFEEGRSYNPGDRASSPGGTEYEFKEPLGTNAATGISPNTNNQRVLMTDPPATRFEFPPEGGPLKDPDTVAGMKRLLQNPGLQQGDASQVLGRHRQYLQNQKRKLFDLPKMSRTEASRMGGLASTRKKDLLTGKSINAVAKGYATARIRFFGRDEESTDQTPENPGSFSPAGQPSRPPISAGPREVIDLTGEDAPTSASRQEPEFVEGSSSRPLNAGTAASSQAIGGSLEEITRQVAELHQQGQSAAEIASQTGLDEEQVEFYLHYGQE